MAPEAQALKLSKPTFENLQKLDIYALGIILSDLIHNPKTVMEQDKIDDKIKGRPPALPKGYKLEGLVEGQLLLSLVSYRSDDRPTIE